MRTGITALVFLLGACSGGGDDAVAPPPPPPASATVTLSADRFLPDSTTIRVGGTVAFVNSSGVLHDVDFGVPALHLAAFDAGTRSLTFQAAGSLRYFCNLHAGMEAILVVR